MPDDPRPVDEQPSAPFTIGPRPHTARLKGSVPVRIPGDITAPPGGVLDPGPTLHPPISPDLPGVSVPDIAFQFRPCLPGSLEDDVKSAITTSIPQAADVRVTCAGASSRVGIWVRPPGAGDDAAARDMALQGLDLLAQGENFAAFINASLVRSRADEEYAKQPKVLSARGYGDPSGPVHLTGLKIDFHAPNTVITTVSGYDERPWPDVNFWLHTTDVLSAQGGELIYTTDHDIETDGSWLNILATIMGALTLAVSGWFAIGIVVFAGQSLLVSRASAPDTGAGAGSAVDALPREIMVPAKLKLVMHYERVEVTEGGIFAGASMVLDLRTPSLRIQGPQSFAVIKGETTVTQRFLVITEDLRAPLSISWTGDGTAATPGERATNFTFQVHPNQGAVTVRRIHVTVTDADGLSAEMGMIVQIHVRPDDEFNDNLPPICRIRPWLPQCNPQP